MSDAITKAAELAAPLFAENEWTYAGESVPDTARLEVMLTYLLNSLFDNDDNLFVSSGRFMLVHDKEMQSVEICLALGHYDYGYGMGE
jgi:hypothetical protein